MVLLIAIIVGAIVGAAASGEGGALAGALFGWLIVRSFRQQREIEALRRRTEEATFATKSEQPRAAPITPASQAREADEAASAAPSVAIDGGRSRSGPLPGESQVAWQERLDSEAAAGVPAAPAPQESVATASNPANAPSRATNIGVRPASESRAASDCNGVTSMA